MRLLAERILFLTQKQAQISISRRWWDILNIFPAEPGCLSYRAIFQPWEFVLEYFFNLIRCPAMVLLYFFFFLCYCQISLACHNIRLSASAGWNSLWMHSENSVLCFEGGQMWLFWGFIYLFIWVAGDKKRSCCCCAIAACRGSWGYISSCLLSERVKGSGGAA